MRLIGSLVPLIIGIISMCFSYSLSLGQLMKPGPGLWPFLSAAVMVICSCILLVRNRDSQDIEEFTPRFRKIVYGMVSLVVFVVLFSVIGFSIPGFLLLCFWLRVLGNESWIVTLAVSLAITFCFYYLFAVLLRVPFPEDFILSIML